MRPVQISTFDGQDWKKQQRDEPTTAVTSMLDVMMDLPRVTAACTEYAYTVVQSGELMIPWDKEGPTSVVVDVFTNPEKTLLMEEVVRVRRLSDGEILYPVEAHA
jgi:hypothetical protein